MEKKSVINRLVKARAKILKLVELLSEEKWNEVFLGKWSVKDLVAHLIGWDIWGLKATREIIQGKLPSYYKYYDEDWVAMNDLLVKRYKKGNKDSLLSAVKNSHHKLVDELEKIPEEMYNKDFNLCWRGQKVNLTSDTLSQADDEEIHAQQGQEWLKTGKPQ